MRVLWRVLISSTIFCISSGFAAEEDTTKTYLANDVVVTATRTEILLSDAPSPIQVLSLEKIQSMNGTAVSDILRFTHGIEIKDYGTTGGIKNIGFRGLSTENVSILIDGQPINNPQYGSMDLSLLPLQTIDRIEVLYSGASALYGGNALGGVINLVTRHPSDSTRCVARIETGSYGRSQMAAELEYRLQNIGVLVNLSKESGKDNYPFMYERSQKSDTTLMRENADYRRDQVFISARGQLFEQMDFFSSMQYADFERGVPSYINWAQVTKAMLKYSYGYDWAVSDYSPSPARQHDKIYRLQAGSTVKVMEGLAFTLKGIYNYNDEQYDENIPIIPTNLLYQSRSYTLNGEMSWALIPEDRILSGMEYGKGWLRVSGSSWGFPFTMEPEREQKSAYLSNEIRIERDAEFLDRVMLFQTVRYDGYSDVRDAAISPKLGANIRVSQSHNIHVRGSWGRNFRVPTFNDLYYPNYNNVNLQPERSTAFDVGITGFLDDLGGQALEATYFHIRTTDKIVVGADWRPYNIGVAENSGIEIRYDYHSRDGKADVFFGLEYIEALKENKDSPIDPAYRKQLVYIPRSSGVMGGSFRSGIGTINIQNSITGLRFINTDNTKSLPAYILTDVNVVNKISLENIRVIVSCAVNNLFDTQYQSVLDYPMPGRMYRISMGIEY